MSRAMACDVCGALSQESGHQYRDVEYKAGDWHRERTSGYRVSVRVDPVNEPNNQYGGIDICKGCFARIARTALAYFGGEPPR